MTDRPRQARWTRTRTQLLDATLSSLVENGYAHTTLKSVEDRAGVSRGALMHHFSSMNDLLIAAIAHVAEQQLAELTESFEALPTGPTRAGAAIRVLYRFMTGPVFLAGLELWFAARTDAGLRSALIPEERRVGEAIGRLMLGPADGALDRVRLAELLALLRGLAITSVLRPRRDLDLLVLEDWIARTAT